MRDLLTKGLQSLGAMAGLALVFAWFGIYGTASMPMLPRFGFWFMTIMTGFGAGVFVEPLVRERLGPHISLPLQLGLVAALVSIPITLLLLAISPGPLSPLRLTLQYGYVLVVSLVVTALNFAYITLSEANSVNTTETDPATGEGTGEAKGEGSADPIKAFLTRLPVEYRTAELYAISAEDHYLRVHTSHGETLILMRLADALRELAAAKGLQTHRSWWVSLEGVSDVQRADGKTSLLLKSGGTALVSRRYAGAVKAAGLS